MAEVIEIPEQNFDALKAEVEKLNRKCVKLDSRKIHIMPIGTREIKDQETGRIARIIEVYLTIPDMKISGWEFVGRIDHRTYPETQRNVVFMNPAVNDVPNTYWDTPSHCQHCEEQRRRNFTFILRNEAGELKQVGSSCLKDFLGHDPLKILKAFELLKKAIHYARGAQRQLTTTDYYWVNTQTYIANTIEVLKTRSWLGASKAREINETRDEDKQVEPTWVLGSERMFRSICAVPTEPEVDEATMQMARAVTDEVIAELEGKDQLNDFEQNLLTIAKMHVMNGRMMKYAAVIAFKWWQKQPKKEKVTSEHFLNVGDKFTGEVEIIGKTRHEGQYGWVTLYRMNYNGNIMITWNSGSFSAEIGQRVKIAGTVKGNDVFGTTKQTNLTRVKVVK